MSIIGIYVYDNFGKLIESCEMISSAINQNVKNKVEKLIEVLPKNVTKILEDKADKLTYGYKSCNNMIYICLAIDIVKTRILYDCLENISKLTVINLKNLGKCMDYHNDPANDKITSIQYDIEVVTDTMMDNIEKILHRGDNLDKLQVDSAKLAENAQAFQHQSTVLKRELCLKNVKFYAIIGIVISVIILFIVLIAKSSK